MKIENKQLHFIGQRMDSIDELLTQLVQGADHDYVAGEIARQTVQVRKLLPNVVEVAPESSGSVIPMTPRRVAMAGGD